MGKAKKKITNWEITRTGTTKKATYLYSARVWFAFVAIGKWLNLGSNE